LQHFGRAVGDAAVTIWINDEESRPARGNARLMLIAAIGGTDAGSAGASRLCSGKLR
jgi:hypothetical protein